MPTSITVVDTSMSVFLSKKFFKVFSFSFLSNEPCISPTFPGNFLLIMSKRFLTDE